LKQNSDHSYDEFVLLDHGKEEWVKDTLLSVSECQTKETEKIEHADQQAQILQQESYHIPGS